MKEQHEKDMMTAYDAIAEAVDNLDSPAGAIIDALLAVIVGVCDSADSKAFDDAAIERLRTIADVLETGAGELQ